MSNGTQARFFRGRETPNGTPEVYARQIVRMFYLLRSFDAVTQGS